MSIDLHIHTTASDGSMRPERVVEMASRLQIGVIAITDHDTISGIDEALASGEKFGVKVIPGVELSSKYVGHDIHILGFFIDYNGRKLLESLERLRKARSERAGAIIKCLQKSGLDVSFEEVLEIAGNASVGRPHIARLLDKKGYVSGFTDAFTKYLKRGAPCFIEKFVYEPDEAISIIHDVGGITVFAHPGLAHLDEHIGELISMGLDGVEAYHIEHSKQTVEHYLKIARDNNLVVTGGSDCHGAQSRHGITLGTVYVPDEIVGELERYKASIGK